MTVTARSLPANLDAERAVLGSVLVTQGWSLDVLGSVLQADHFYLEKHKMIYRAMLALSAAAAPIDSLSLKDALHRAGTLDGIGGPAYVASLEDGVPRSVNVEYYARIVREDDARRRVILAAEALLEQAYRADEGPAELLEATEQRLLELSVQASPGEPVTAQASAVELREDIARVVATKTPLTGLDTGFAELNRYTRGLQPGALVLIAGRPGTGKSALGLQMAMWIARTVPVLFVSVEMSRRELGMRAVSFLSGIDSHRLQCGYISGHEQRLIDLALEDYGRLRLRIEDTGTVTPIQIRSWSRRLKAREGLGLIVVDYLQLLQHAKLDSREQAVASTSRLMKQLARELDLPVLVLCQLSRAAESAKDQRPMLSHLRESGSLEQDADLVLLIHRQGEKSDGVVRMTPTVQLIIAKSRNGPQGEIEMTWAGEQYRFAELAS